MKNSVHVKVDDTVIVLSGKNKNAVGKVMAVSPKEGKVIVKGVNVVKKHTKPRRQGEVGGILEVEGAIYASKVQLVCQNSKCEKYNKGVRVRVEVRDGKKVRVCTKCGATYHITVNPPKTSGICDHCGSEVVIRKDDAAETVRNRLKVYHESTEILKGYYATQNKLRLVEGNQPIEDAYHDILRVLGETV